jgi:hypothetical protein
MRAAFEHMLLKAWEACEQADLQSGRCTSQRQPPPLLARILGSRGNPASEIVPEPRRETDQAKNNANNATYSNDLLTMSPDAMLAAQLTPTSSTMFGGMDQVYAATLNGYNYWTGHIWCNLELSKGLWTALTECIRGTLLPSFCPSCICMMHPC